MKAVALHPLESKWTVMNGPQKGAVQTLAQNTLLLGRSAECDIVIVEDPKCSRKHAKVEWTDRGYVIEILSKNNVLKVNGERLEMAILEDGDVICLGETEVLFNLIGQAQLPTLAIGPGGQGWAAPPAHIHNTHQTVIGYQDARPAPNPSRPSKKRKLANKTRFYIYGAILLIVVWLFIPSGTKNKKELAIRTQQQVDQDIEAAKKLQAAAEAQRRNNNLSPSFEVRQAQENYVKGFRDFQKGQYERALESFQACLALYPDHVLCNRYLKLSQRKFNELVQYHMVLGRKYRDQEQYRACRAAFRNVMVMVKDFSSPIYKEAKANFDACNSYVEGLF